MSELRKDPIVNRWVVIAPERSQRPIELQERLQHTEPGIDPFAEGNEAATTPEILAFRDAGSAPDGPGWRVRVVPNKFPALHVDGPAETHHDGIHQAMNGIGAHEVIIECPHAEAHLSRLSAENIREVLAAYRQRLRDLKRDPRMAHATIFKNHGPPAGASLPHSHSQLMATPFVPPAIVEELAGALDYYQRHRQNVFEAMIQQELAQQSRIVVESARYVALCPYASRFSYETWILPRQPGSHFEAIDDPLLGELAGTLKSVLARLDVALDDPPFNYVFHSAPLQEPDLPHYRWHIEILPRLFRTAGYEWGSGCFINEVPPEQAAAALRRCELS